jgi:DnaJ family protein C protein 9
VNFQKLVTAYNILKDLDSRKLYDESGYIEGEGFDKAADFFRTKFGRISEQDIFDFEKKYKKSQEEVEDVKNYYNQNNGDISKLLEWIPLSEPTEVDRFIEIVNRLILSKDVKETVAFKSSIPKLRKNAEKMKKEQAKYDKENSGGSMADLALAIQERRMKSSEFFDNLITKYANADSGRKKRKY